MNAEHIAIAADSSPEIPQELLDLGEYLILSDDVLAWDDLPQSVAVIGAGVIGLELGQALHRLGLRIAIFGRVADRRN